MILASYNPDWAAEFAAIEKVFASALGGNIVRIEHVGSTAVPGLSAKPILDIDIVIPGYEVFDAVADGLRKLGYTHNGDQGIAEREAFKREDDFTPWTEPRREWMAHHLYVCPVRGEELRRHVKFRDALRSDAGLRNDYEAIKQGIAGRAGGDRKLYARIKETECREFVEKVLRS